MRRWSRFGASLDELSAAELEAVRRTGLLTEAEHKLLAGSREKIRSGDAAAVEAGEKAGIIHPSYRAEFARGGDVSETARLALYDFTRTVRDRYRAIEARFGGKEYRFEMREPALTRVTVERGIDAATAKVIKGSLEELMRALNVDLHSVEKGEHFEALLMPHERFEDGRWALRVVTEDGKLSKAQAKTLEDSLLALPDRFGTLEDEGVVLRLTDGDLEASPSALPWHVASVDFDRSAEGLDRFADWIIDAREKEAARIEARAKAAGKSVEELTSTEPTKVAETVDEAAEVAEQVTPAETPDTQTLKPEQEEAAPLVLTGSLAEDASRAAEPELGKLKARIELGIGRRETTTTNTTTTDGVVTAQSSSMTTTKLVSWDPVFAELADAAQSLRGEARYREALGANDIGAVIRTAGKGETEWDLLSGSGRRAAVGSPNELDQALAAIRSGGGNAASEFAPMGVVTPGVLAVQFAGDGFAKHANALKKILNELGGETFSIIDEGRAGFTLDIESDRVRAHVIRADGSVATVEQKVTPSSRAFRFWLDSQIQELRRK